MAGSSQKRDTLAPECALSDPGLSADDNSARHFDQPGGERLDEGELEVSPDKGLRAKGGRGGGVAHVPIMRRIVFAIGLIDSPPRAQPPM